MEKESYFSKILRFQFNYFPAYRCCGAKIIYVSAELLDVKIELPLRRNNKSHIGSIWGGSLYSSIDTVYTIMLSQTFGIKYILLDKDESIHFLKPAYKKLYAHLRLDKPNIEHTALEYQERGKTERIYDIELKDDNDRTYLHAEKQYIYDIGCDLG